MEWRTDLHGPCRFIDLDETDHTDLSASADIYIDDFFVIVVQFLVAHRPASNDDFDVIRIATSGRAFLLLR